MTEKPVSHEQIGAQITALDKRVAAHEKHMNVTVGRLFEKADEATAAAHASSLQLAKMQISMENILGGRTEHLNRLDRHEVEIAELKLTNSRHDGERGVISALMRSPLIGWLAAAGAVLWGTIKNVSAHVPMVMFALLVTASLAQAALA